MYFLKLKASISKTVEELQGKNVMMHDLMLQVEDKFKIVGVLPNLDRFDKSEDNRYIILSGMVQYPYMKRDYTWNDISVEGEKFVVEECTIDRCSYEAALQSEISSRSQKASKDMLRSIRKGIKELMKCNAAF